MKRKRTSLTTAGGLAVAGVVLLLGYVRTADAKADDLVSVVVADRAIPAGTPVSELADDITEQKVPTDKVERGALETLHGLTGKVLSVDLAPGQQVVASRLVAPSAVEHIAVPDGLLEVALSLDPVRALGGTVRPGDRVAVIASSDKSAGDDPTTSLLLQKVLVTRVQFTEAPTADQPDGQVKVAPHGPMLVTLAVDEASATQVVAAAEHGRIWLAEAPDTGR
jgi:pilus assembly protein CpaB